MKRQGVTPKGVSRRFRSVKEVRASLRAHRDMVGEQLVERPVAQRLVAQSDGAFSYQPYFDHVDEELAAIEHVLTVANDAHVCNLVKIADYRRQSEELTADVYDKQVAARQLLIGAYGSGRDFELAAASGKTPRFSETLAHQVDQTVKLLRRPQVTEPRKRIAGARLDFEEMAEDLEGSLEQLLDARTHFQDTRKAADGTRAVTNAAKKQFDASFPWLARGLESFFRLAGEPELADRIRTSTRRVTRRQAEDPEEEASETAPSEEVAAVEPASEVSATEIAAEA